MRPLSRRKRFFFGLPVLPSDLVDHCTDPERFHLSLQIFWPRGRRWTTGTKRHPFPEASLPDVSLSMRFRMIRASANPAQQHLTWKVSPTILAAPLALLLPIVGISSRGGENDTSRHDAEQSFDGGNSTRALPMPT